MCVTAVKVCVSVCEVTVWTVMQRAWPLLGPLKWIRYVNKQVKVKAGKDEEMKGFLVTVDPVTAR